MIFVFIFSLLLSIFYSYLIFRIYLLWNKITIEKLETNITQNSISVIIAVRNEEENIIECLTSILNNDYPSEKYEVIIIDDHSNDDTREKIKSIRSDQIKLYSLTEDKFGKKAAITYGVNLARYSLILCTDGDCMVGKNWLNTHNSFYSSGQNMMCTGIVLPANENSILSDFQYFDFSAIMAVSAYGITTGNFFLANGANISYRKNVFDDLDGFSGNENIASGDDLFLMHKLGQKRSDSIRFIASNQGAVITKSEKSWSDLIEQRIRWASKSIETTDSNLKALQAFVFIYNMVILGYFFCLIFSFSLMGLLSFAVVLSFKLITDYFFLKIICDRFRRQIPIKSFFACFGIYFIHIICSGIVALAPKFYLWKGRKVR